MAPPKKANAEAAAAQPATGADRSGAAEKSADAKKTGDAEKTPKQRPEKPDEEKYKADLAEAEKSHKTVMDKLVRTVDFIVTI
jgi:hypothetical protein